MPDGNVIDSLSIEIGASVDKSLSAINEVTDALKLLNGALENFKDNGTYKKALDNLSGGFTNLNRAVEAFDPDKIEAVSRALNKLTKASNKIDSAFGGEAKYGKAVSAMNKEMKEQGRTLATNLGITGTKNVENVADAFVELSNEIDSSGKKTLSFADKLSKFAKTAQGSLDVSGMIDNDESSKKIVDYFASRNKSGNKVYLPFTPSEFKGDYSSMRSVMGKVFTSNSKYRGEEDILSFAKGFNSSVGEYIDIGEGGSGNGNAANVFSQLYELLSYAKDYQDKLTRAAQEHLLTEQQIVQVVEQELPVVQQIKSAMASEGASDENGFTTVAKSLKEMVGIEIPDFTNLKTLASATNKLGSSEATTAGTNLPPLLEGLKSIGDGGITIPDFTNLKTLASSVVKLGDDKAQSAAWVLPNIMAELESFSQHFGNLSLDANSLGTIQSLGSAFSKLGGKNSSEAITNLPQLSDAIRQMVEDLNGLPEVSDKTKDLVVALGNLAKSNKTVSQGLNGIKQSTGKLNAAFTMGKAVIAQYGNAFKQGYQSALTYSKGMNVAKYHTESLTMAIVKVRTLLWGLRRVFSVFSESIENASSLTEVQNVIENVYDASYIDQFNESAQNAIKTLGMSQLSFSQYASRYQAMGKALGITNSQMKDAEDRLKSLGVEYGVTTGQMGDMSVNITKLAGDMASFYDVDQADVYQDLQAIFTGQTRPLSVAA